MNTETSSSSETIRPSSVVLNPTEDQMFSYLRHMANSLSSRTKIPYASICVEVTRMTDGSYEQRAKAYVDGSSHIESGSVYDACDKQVAEFRPIAIKNLRAEADALLKKAEAMEQEGVSA